MLYKEEEDEVSLLFVNDCFYDKHNEVVDFIDKHKIVPVHKVGSLSYKVQIRGSRRHKNQGTDERSKGRSKAVIVDLSHKCFDYALQGGRRRSQFTFRK
ncbi:hypothetical protein ACT3CD_03520 [Geofilum sp. OHC36d9]|uniref:hypothetical protein n=1 Tax=Geofilum sp. OHC36d9 TaxID=3458413 RepID=UPI004033DDDC